LIYINIEALFTRIFAFILIETMRSLDKRQIRAG